MLWDKLIPKKYHIKQMVCGIEVSLTDDEPVFYYSLLRIKNGKLLVVESGSCIGELKLPPAYVKNKIPILLAMTGRGILFKKISLTETEGSDVATLISQHLPALDQRDFAIQIYPQQNGTAFITFCRREIVDTETERFKNKKLELAGVYIGVPVIVGLQPLWNDFAVIQCSHWEAELANNCLENIIEKTPAKQQELKIDDTVLHPQQILAFSAGLCYLLQNNPAITQEAKLLQLQNEHIERNKFRFLIITAVAAAMAIALINVAFYSNYFEKNNKLENDLSIYQGKYEQVNNLLEDYQQKKNLFENTGILDKCRLSEFADKIAVTIPSDVMLSEMYLNPRSENEEEIDSTIAFTNKTIIIKGNCNKSLVVNDWVNVLKMQKFIRTVSLEKFLYGNEGFVPNYEIKLETE